MFGSFYLGLNINSFGSICPRDPNKLSIKLSFTSFLKLLGNAVELRHSFSASLYFGLWCFFAFSVKK